MSAARITEREALWLAFVQPAICFACGLLLGAVCAVRYVDAQRPTQAAPERACPAGEAGYPCRRVTT